MVWFVVIVAVLKLVGCLTILITPNFLRKAIDFFYIGSRIYLVGFIRLVLGIVLLILAPQTRLWGYVVILGLLSAAGGISFFFLALKRIKILLNRLQRQSNLILRLLATVALIIWVLLLYSLLPAVRV